MDGCRDRVAAAQQRHAPDADTLLLKFLQRYGAAGDAGREALSNTELLLNSFHILVVAEDMNIIWIFQMRTTERRFNKRAGGAVVYLLLVTHCLAQLAHSKQEA